MAVWLVHLKRGGKSRRKPVFSFGGTELHRTRIYIDGYNLYYGCLKGTPYKWLDLLTLFERIIQSSATGLANNQKLVPTLLPDAVRFCTALILEQAASADDSVQCQERYHSALRKHQVGRIEIIKGYYSLTKARAKLIDPSDEKKWPRDCQHQADIWKLEEKQTDVNLALHAFKDAITGEVDHVVVVTNDTDIAPALSMIRSSTDVAVGLVIPTTDHLRYPNTDLAKHAHWVRSHITVDELKEAQLPRVIPGGRNPVVKPDSWYARPELLARALEIGQKDLGSRSKVFQWLTKPNSYWGGQTPLEILESHEGEKVIAFMESWSGSSER